MTLIYIIFTLDMICEQYILRLLYNKHYFLIKTVRNAFYEYTFIEIVLKGNEIFLIFKIEINV